MKKLIVTICIVVLSAFFASAQTATVREIDKYVKTVKKLTKSQRKIVVADTAEYDQTKNKWRKFASEKALEKFRDKTETYSIAYNWKRGDKVLATHFTDFSPSGDWAHYTFHYFRADGSTAKVEAELRTFYGDYIVTRTYYLNAKGKVIRKFSKYRDLTTGKPKAPTDEMRAENVGAFSVKYYRSVNTLPFSSLLR